jgi:hypothetical protein
MVGGGTYEAGHGEGSIDVEEADCVCDGALVERGVGGGLCHGESGNWFGLRRINMWEV